MNLVLFLDAGFDQLRLGIARDNRWLVTQSHPGRVVDHLGSHLENCFEASGFQPKHLSKIYLLNGPGSTLGIRTICAFANTAVAGRWLAPSAIQVSNHLHFFQLYLTQIAKKHCPFQLNARVNLIQTLQLSVTQPNHYNLIGPVPTETIHRGMEQLWLPHPALPAHHQSLDYDLPLILPLFQSATIWSHPFPVDVFALKTSAS